MNRETTHHTLVSQSTRRTSRRAALRDIALHSGLVSLGVLASGMAAEAAPSADCRFYCKKKDRRKARRRCYDRCDRAMERCRANPECVAEQICGNVRCMMICQSDSDCQSGSHCQNGACVSI
jgi:hypothetical protein